MLGAVLAVLVSGFVIGGLARWAVPGPDPMPVWLTVLIGLLGSAVGGSIAAAKFGTNTRGDYFAITLISIVASALIVVAYRHFVQRRPLTGPEAYKLPTRGVGIARLRKRLERLGIDPNTVSSRSPGSRLQPRPESGAESLRKLQELRDQGLLTEEEYEERKRRLEQER